MEVLDQGGNAADAAVAISYAISVLEPQASGIGGGGLMLVHAPEEQEPVAFDYRETAPNQNNKPDPGIGVPGFVRGMEKVNANYGSQPIEDLMEPAIELAMDGVDVSYTLHTHLQNAYSHIEPQTADVFFPGGRAIEPGDPLVQEELGRTLKTIQEEGPGAFYHGPIGDRIITRIDGLGREDLAGYDVQVRHPVRATFAGMDVYAAPPPAGGTMLVHALQMAERLSLDEWADNPSEFMKRVGGIARTAYEDRVQTIGDPAFVDVPLTNILDSDYVDNLAKEFLDDTGKDPLPEDMEGGETDGNTTHFVIVDEEGMMVSATNTLSSFFGSGIYMDGFFLNNQLDNFSASTTSPNRYEPGKRPISYITPTIIAADGQPKIGIGSSGGRRITSTLTQVLVRHLLMDEPIEDAIEANRSFYDFHSPTISVEGRIPPDVTESLEQEGYTVDHTKSAIYFGSVQSIVVDDEAGIITGGADSRRGGEWDAH
ncbi:gamma-glutamyltransferase [Geomicrobium sp. JCM 19039]|uniref:gamma-glutamyltransferase n=1 Tax=Geomicrobium sp. JCM 19039 TaxID=1460636 RepID=UPI00045F2853|nr:gamma-glutamyltransferase [Geomicrobium sp. JCM 19039]GAK14101.1 gamma-glutamyltranspeptidase [Geomicrobium sp. JCM 19039]